MEEIYGESEKFKSLNTIIDNFPNTKIKTMTPLTFSVNSNKDKLKESIINDLDSKGFCLIRDFLPIKKCENLMKSLEKTMTDLQIHNESGEIIKPKDNNLSGYSPLTNSLEFKNLVEGEEIKSFLNWIFPLKRISTLDTKWIRIIGNGESTSLHSDYFRFHNFPPKMYTVWFPLSIFKHNHSKSRYE